MASALLMLSLRSTLRSILCELEEHDRIIRRLNKVVGEDLRRMGSFATLCLLGFARGPNLLTCSNAGHHSPMVFSVEGTDLLNSIKQPRHRPGLLMDKARGEPQLPLAWVEEGRVRVEHADRGPYPVLKPCHGLELYVNKILREEPIPVTREDKITVRPISEEVKGTWSLKVSPDCLLATLELRPHIFVKRELPDLPPAAELQLAVQENRQRSPVLTLPEIYNELAKRGITHGIDWGACEEATQALEEKEIIIARGTPAEPGKPAALELFFSLSDKVPIDYDPEATIDFRQRFRFTSVAPGTVLARKKPPVPGKPGCDIYGSLIPPPPEEDLEIVAGRGVVLSRDGLEAIAQAGGRPQIRRWGRKARLDILEILEHYCDVDLACGNISYQGDVHIKGNVREGMTVKATGNIQIAGYVEQAKIQAGGQVVILGNVLSSEVIAGGPAALLKDFLPLLSDIRSKLLELLAAVEQVSKNPAFKKADLRSGPGPLLRLLLEGKFKRLPFLVRRFKDALEALPGELKENRLTEFSRGLESALILSPLAVKDLAVIQDLAEKASGLEGEFVFPPGEASDLTLKYALNSMLAATGRINIIGVGCYNSRLKAGAGVSIRGVCRGGEIEAGGDVYIGELGSRGGVATVVRASATAKICIGVAWENSLVQIGNQTRYIEREERNIRLGVGG